MSKPKIKNPGGPEKGHRGFFVYGQLYVCNRAKECGAYWCVHQQPHFRREDEDDVPDDPWDIRRKYRRIENYGQGLLQQYIVLCTQWKEKNVHTSLCPCAGEKVRCVKVKAKRRMAEGHYGICIYMDESEDGNCECCNGVDEGTECIGNKCEAFEQNGFGFEYIELIGV